MTELEKFDARIEAVEAAITATKSAMVIDRKLSHDKHGSGHFTKALTELTDVHTGLKALKIRFETVGR
jgi:hypothetical protein